MEVLRPVKNSSYRNTLQYRIDRFAEQIRAERQRHERTDAGHLLLQSKVTKK